MVAEVGIDYGYLIFNAESLSSNQQFCVKSWARGVKKPAIQSAFLTPTMNLMTKLLHYSLGVPR